MSDDQARSLGPAAHPTGRTGEFDTSPGVGSLGSKIPPAAQLRSCAAGRGGHSPTVGVECWAWGRRVWILFCMGSLYGENLKTREGGRIDGFEGNFLLIKGDDFQKFFLIL